MDLLVLTRRARLILLLCCSLPTLAQNVTPVGLITEASGARLRREGTLTDVPAYRGDLLFPGDAVFTDTGSFSLSFCPTRQAYSISKGTIQLDSKRVKTERSEARTRPLAVCVLPSVTSNDQGNLRLYADTIQIELAQTKNPAPASPLPQAAQAQLQSVDAVLKQDANNLTLRVARAAILESAEQLAGAAREYQEIAATIPNARWSREKARSITALSQRSIAAGGRTVAVVIGISKYSHLPECLQLKYADEDAKAFYEYLTSPRGGASAKDVTLLLNEQASHDAIRTAIATVFGKAEANDRAILFVAGHGVSMEQGPNRGAYIVASDSDLEELKTTAVAMQELQALMNGQYRPQEIRLFVDACHAGQIGSILNRDFTNEKFNHDLATVVEGDYPSHVFGFMASRQSESSFECPTLGHGAFTYFLLRGLSTAEATDDRSGTITADSLIDYVSPRVRRFTDRNQNPEPKGNFQNTDQIADPKVSGPAFTNVAPPERCGGSFQNCSGPRGIIPPREPIPPGGNTATNNQLSISADFDAALSKGILLPGLPGSAFDALTGIRTSLLPAQYVEARNRLLVALETAGQKIILQYLKGEAVPQTRDEFLRGEQLFTAAAQLISGDPYVQSRHSFFRGRRLIFDHQYGEAAAALETAIRLYPTGAYSYNALGIAFLETAQFQRAISAFRDAIRLAPYWAYARHNLALAQTQAGQYSDAIKTYRGAMDLRPRYSYISYNLGLLYERLNRPQEAREAWHESLSIAPEMARAWNAIGLSFFLENHLSAAKNAYLTALPLATQETDRLAIRHDLALLFVKEGDTAEAIRLWRLNLAERHDDLPTLIGLSDTLAAARQTQAALDALSALVDAKPDYVAARLQYAKALLKAGRVEEATQQLASATAYAGHNSDVLEQIADLYIQAGQNGRERALVLYRRSLDLVASSSQRKRIHLKIQNAENER